MYRDPRCQCGVLESDGCPMQTKHNLALEFSHSNLKSILNIAKNRFVGRQMNWVI